MTRTVRRDGGVSLLRLRRLADQFRQSLFFLPAIFVMLSVVLAEAIVQVDRTLDSSDLPSAFSTTVDNARSILATVAGGTISAAAVVFSLTLIAVQLASSQFSPRVLRGFLGDRFQQVVMGIVVGTFTYSLVVLRVVQQPLDQSEGTPFLPRLSVLLAVIFAVASLLAVLASIDHTAKSLRVGALLDHVTAETLQTIERRFVRLDSDDLGSTLVLDAPGVVPAVPRWDPVAEEPINEHHEPPTDAFVIRAKRSGWVTQISVEGILEAIDEHTTVLLRVAVGTYAFPGTPVVSVWPVPDDCRSAVEADLRDAIEIRHTRTLQQDVSFGLLQLTDIAMKALSPGVNDPNTAIEAVSRIGVVLSALLQCELAAGVLESDSRTVVRSRRIAARDYVDAAVEPIRRYAKAEPNVLQVLVRTLASVREVAQAQSEVEIDVSSLDEQIDRIHDAISSIDAAEGRESVGYAVAEARR